MTEKLHHKRPNAAPQKAPKTAQPQPPFFAGLVQETLPNNLHADQILHLQRTLGNQAVLQLLRRNATMGGVIQRAPVNTTFGTFTDEEYTEVNSDGQRGVSMKLTFTPGKQVNAEQIGMTQSVKSYENGAPITLDPGQKDRMVENGPGAGFKLDRITGNNNPIYGSPGLKEGEGLTDTPETDAPGEDVGSGDTDAKYQLGWHYYEGKTLKTQNAEMHDKPVLYKPPANSGQEFETTALALSGSDKDAYYGSVRWGWQTDGDGNFTKLELTKVSDAVPSANFLEAAKKWNDFSYKAKISKPDADGNCTVTAPLTVTNDSSDFTVAAGSTLNIDVNKEAIGGKLLAILDEPILIEDGKPGLTGWLPTADIGEGKITTDKDLTKGGKSYKVAAGTTFEATDSVVGEDTLVYIKQGKVLSADVGLRIVWLNEVDVFGAETADLPIPGKMDSVWAWWKWATNW